MAFVLFTVIVCSQWTEGLSLGAVKTKKFRNFYGVYIIYETQGQRHLKHGTTLHGRQYMEGPKAKIPLSYFHPTTPAGELLSTNRFKFSSVGMIGLGAGSIAAYMDSTQTLTIYELDPDGLMVAEKYFSYLRFAKENGAHLNFVFGDGRISLRNVADGTYDLLIIDAFNSDSIPIHLMTVEAIKEYSRVLTKDGLLLMHISNRIFNLSPVLFSAAQRLGLYACKKTNSEYVDPDADVAEWMAVSRNRQKYEILINMYHWTDPRTDDKNRVSPWTDQYSNLLEVLR